MYPNRRAVILGATSLTISACVSARPIPRPEVVQDPDMRPQENAGWRAWVNGFRPRALNRGISGATFDRAFGDAGFLPGVVERDRNQTEFTRTLEDYIQIAASETKVTEGRAAYGRQSRTLQAIERRYGVESEVVAAIWGLESRYGTRRGTVPIVSALSTLAYDGRRGQFMENQLIAALQILQSGDTTPQNLRGSWAGAMGHTQFIPTSYQSLAVDFTGDGRRDIWSDDPTDALASTANYLARNGWRSGQPWGHEITASNPGSGGRVIQPQPGGPRFRVYHNFDVIKRYNNSDLYALGVGHLSDRLGGAGPLRSGFPPDRFGLTMQDRIRVQEGLNRAGYDAGTPDGVFGSGTERAIAAFERANGQPVTGRPTPALLSALGVR